MFLVGAGLFIWALLSGDFDLYLFLGFVPVLTADTVRATAAILLLFFGFFVLVVSMYSLEEESGTSISEDPPRGSDAGGIKTGGVVLIGPIPIVWGSDNRTAILVLVIALIILSLALLLFI